MPETHDLPAPHTVRDICDSQFARLDSATTAAVATSALRPDGIGLVSSDRGRLPIGVISSEVLRQLDREVTGDIIELADPVLLVAADLPLDRAFRILLAHPELRWLVVEADEPGQPAQGLISRGKLVPASLERFEGTAMDRVGLPGDPIVPASGLSYRCPEDPDNHVFTAVQIETWTAGLRALCPVDGKVMTAYVATAKDSRGN